MINYSDKNVFGKIKGFKSILDKGAFFIVRCKGNLQYRIREYLEVNLPDKVTGLLEGVRGMKIVLKNDKSRDSENKRIEYRLVVFSAMGESYVLIKNRFNLSTYEVIMLYAYRWQVELIFHFIKRTFKSIHLLCHDPKGLQLYLYMISYLLLLSFNQEYATMAEEKTQEEEVSELKDVSFSSPKAGRHYVCGLVSMLGQELKKYWKISVHWLITVRNFFLKSFTVDIAKRIVACSAVDAKNMPNGIVLIPLLGIFKIVSGLPLVLNSASPLSKLTPDS